ncbi:MAG: hypothetical protein JF588_04020 [Caulobacterales bacterium]|nr:hypothetical protein [Caulobacterales bacterium]
MSVDGFVSWLADTPVSEGIGAHGWITPAVQTVHILAIAVVMSAILMTNLRALGAVGGGEPMARFSRHYAPRIGAALLVLLISGATLIVGEPKRSLENPVFLLKMAMLIAALALATAIHLPLRHDAEFWTPGARRIALRVMAGGSLAIWVAIIFAGRWIAYAVT